MTLADGAWLDEIYPIYVEIQSLKHELESSLTIEQARDEYSKLIAEEDSELDSLKAQKRKLEVEIRLPNTVRPDTIPIKPLPDLPDNKGFQNGSSTSTDPSTDKNKSSQKKPATEARDKLKKLVNRFYKFELDASVLGQINRIADDVDRPLGEALALLDWSIFENYARTHTGNASKLNLLHIASWLAEEIESRCGIPISPNDQVTRNILRQKAEEAKILLSTKDTVIIDLPSLDLGHPSTSFDAQIELSREQLEKCAAKIVQRTLDITKRVIESVAGFTWKDIDEVILVGWQTLMPSIQQQIEELTGQKPHVSDRPQLAVALGAGEYAQILSLGQEKFQANTLINVIALPLGIRLDDDTFEVLVEANKTLPYTSKLYPVTTTEDNQQSILVEVLQGPKETTKASDCVVLGFVKMNILSPAPKGIPKFEVVLDIQSDGTMYVKVKDTSTGKVEIQDLIANTARKNTALTDNVNI